MVQDTNNEAIRFTFVGDTVQFTSATRQRRFALEDSAVLGPDYQKGDEVYVPWKMTTEDGTEWYVTDQWRRVPVARTKRVLDTKRAA